MMQGSWIKEVLNTIKKYSKIKIKQNSSKALKGENVFYTVEMVQSIKDMYQSQTLYHNFEIYKVKAETMKNDIFTFMGDNRTIF